MKEDKKKILRFRNTRKIYLPFYLMSLALIGIVIYFYSSGNPVNITALAVVGIFIVLGVKLTELHRFNNLYEVNQEVFSHRIGIISRKTETIDFLTISHIDIIQNLWQRIFNYGDVDLKVFSQDNLKPIKSVNSPYKLVRFLEDRVEDKRRGDPLPQGKSSGVNKTYHKRIIR